MKNIIRSKGKTWKRRSKNLTSGEIQCPRCGEWKKVPKLTDKHFNEEYTCRTCKKEINLTTPRPTKATPQRPKRFKPQFPDDCPHKAFFWCKSPSECIGCYYNPDKKIALMQRSEDDEKKTAKDNWFYHDKKHAKECLSLLDDIRLGKGLFKNGTRCRFKHARKDELEEDI